MCTLINSGHIVPLGAFVVAIFLAGFAAWKKVREMELRHHADLRTREMEHELKLKEIELERARIK